MRIRIEVVGRTLFRHGVPSPFTRFHWEAYDEINEMIASSYDDASCYCDLFDDMEDDMDEFDYFHEALTAGEMWAEEMGYDFIDECSL